MVIKRFRYFKQNQIIFLLFLNAIFSIFAQQKSMTKPKQRQKKRVVQAKSRSINFSADKIHLKKNNKDEK
ncbi:MAG TPA: hypothetical protein DCG69_02580 [Bacteroidales bacterium]|nr:hypothetical protein [Bacteroidales bacterium]